MPITTNAWPIIINAVDWLVLVAVEISILPEGEYVAKWERSLAPRLPLYPRYTAQHVRRQR